MSKQHSSTPHGRFPDMCTASCDPRRHGVCPTCRPHGASLHHWWCIPLHELITEGNIKKLSVCWYMYTFTWCCVCPDTEFFLVHFNPEFVCYCYVTALIASSLSHDLFKCQLFTPQLSTSEPCNQIIIIVCEKRLDEKKTKSILCNRNKNGKSI